MSHARKSRMMHDLYYLPARFPSLARCRITVSASSTSLALQRYRQIFLPLGSAGTRKRPKCSYERWAWNEIEWTWIMIHKILHAYHVRKRILKTLVHNNS